MWKKKLSVEAHHKQHCVECLLFSSDIASLTKTYGKFGVLKELYKISSKIKGFFYHNFDTGMYMCTEEKYLKPNFKQVLAWDSIVLLNFFMRT